MQLEKSHWVRKQRSRMSSASSLLLGPSFQSFVFLCVSWSVNGSLETREGYRIPPCEIQVREASEASKQHKPLLLSLVTQHNYMVRPNCSRVHTWTNQSHTDPAPLLAGFNSACRCWVGCWERKDFGELEPELWNTAQPGKTCVGPGRWIHR